MERWRESQPSDVMAKLIIYRAFIEGEIDLTKHLAHPVHDLYFNAPHEEFIPRTMWSLSNVFISALKLIDSTPQFRATAKLGAFLEARVIRQSRRHGANVVRAHDKATCKKVAFLCQSRIPLPVYRLRRQLLGESIAYAL